MRTDDAGHIVLELDDVSASYGSMTVLRKVTLTASAGEVLGVLGPNGAGKTTLVEAIAGRVISAGHIRLRGERIDQAPSHRRARAGIALVPDTRGLFRTMSVAENLALGVRMSPAAGRTAALERSMDLFPILRDRRTQAAGLLSGGEQQMLAIAKAIVGGPKILILDEPTQGLAPHLFEVLTRAVAALRSDGLAVVVVEQNYVFAQSVADRAVVLSGGRLVRSLTTEQLQTSADVIDTYLGAHDQ